MASMHPPKHYDQPLSQKDLWILFQQELRASAEAANANDKQAFEEHFALVASALVALELPRQ